MVAASKSVACLFLTLFALYAIFAARAFLTSPTISRNYLAEINASTATIPESDRAWPLYRRAYLAQPRMPKDILKDFPVVSAVDPLWPVAVEYMKESRATLELLRQAAARPALGLELSNIHDDPELDAYQIWLMGTDMDKARAQAKENADRLRAVQVNDPNPELITVLLPHLGTMRHFARLLVFDAREATHAGDAARVHANLQAIYRMGAHASEHGFLIGSLVNLAINDLATQELGNILRDQPALLTNDQLASLAHLASTSAPRLDLGGERMYLADILQRIYTDDGHGDGHLTAEGFRQLNKYFTIHGGYSDNSGISAQNRLRDDLLVGAASGISLSRRQIAEKFDAILDSAARYAGTPPWERTDEQSPDLIVEKLTADSLTRARYGIVLALSPALTRTTWAYDEAAQRRAAVLTAVALELHRRTHGSFPARLADLDASLLPKLPLDMFDGQPVRYTLTNGAPLLYSVGVDRKDDQGRASKAVSYAAGNPARWMSEFKAKNALRDQAQRPAIDGDWILWPSPPEPPKPQSQAQDEAKEKPE